MVVVQSITRYPWSGPGIVTSWLRRVLSAELQPAGEPVSE
jgi:hypothetical protein